MNIPMSSPDLTEAEIAAVNRVLNTPVLSLGPRSHIAPGGALLPYQRTRDPFVSQ